ncbi:MAG: hypothetical protein ABJF23_22510 [Bryobacteraceae bacterium]
MEHHVSDPSIGHETQDAGVRMILISGLVLAILVAAAGGLMYGTFRYLVANRATAPRDNPMSSGQPVLPPEPRIEEHPALGLQQLHALEDRTLSTYGWTDKKTGVVRIPVDRAMDLQLQRGFPTRKETAK